ncbi:hypothetical protein [Neptuniibacter sp. QD57_21]|uniref:hypothetical protein n=1 Tax=Neptuniibacter sp. QD57_21 TaxID=3398213 RepID=UPI0039F6181F
MNKLREQLERKGIPRIVFYLSVVSLVVIASLIFRWAYNGNPFTDSIGIMLGVYGAYLVAAFSVGSDMQIGYSTMENTDANGLSRMMGLVFGIVCIFCSILEPLYRSSNGF